MATDQGVTRWTGNGSESSLLCGKPGCEEPARLTAEFEWNGWVGIIGACWEHHEDLLVHNLPTTSSAEEPT